MELVIRDSRGDPTPRNLYVGFGSSVIRIQDMNDDGIADLAVGARGHSDPKGVRSAGAVFLCTMNTTGNVTGHKLITDVSPTDELLMPMEVRVLTSERMYGRICHRTHVSCLGKRGLRCVSGEHQ